MPAGRNGAGGLRLEGLPSLTVVRSTGVLGLPKEDRIYPSGWDGDRCEACTDSAFLIPRIDGNDLLVRSVRPGVLELTTGAGSLEGRCPRILLVDDVVGVGEAEGVVEVGRLDTEDWAEWPSLDCDLLNLDKGAPLSETVSRWVECVRS